MTDGPGRYVVQGLGLPPLAACDYICRTRSRKAPHRCTGRVSAAGRMVPRAPSSPDVPTKTSAAAPPRTLRLRGGHAATAIGSRGLSTRGTCCWPSQESGVADLCGGTPLPRQVADSGRMAADTDGVGRLAKRCPVAERTPPQVITRSRAHDGSHQTTTGQAITE